MTEVGIMKFGEIDNYHRVGCSVAHKQPPTVNKLCGARSWCNRTL